MAKMFTELKTGERYSSKAAQKKHEKGESIQERIKEYGKNSPKVKMAEKAAGKLTKVAKVAKAVIKKKKG
mgnify:CR=1 FL=1